jgi:hypothetical protein
MVTKIKLCDRVMIFLSESGSMPWPINQRDKVKRRFITYLAGNNKAELKKACYQLDIESFELRTAERLKDYKYECKIAGLAWNDALELGKALGAGDRLENATVEAE